MSSEPANWFALSLQHIQDTNPEILRLTIEFFFTFSRLEYALKAAGFWRKGKKVEVDWKGFALVIEDDFFSNQTESLARACRYFSDHPPRKQKIRDDKLIWEEAPPDTDNRLDTLLILIRRVRNNLFHGGKWQVDGILMSPRDHKLLQHSLTIMQRCINCHSEVIRRFQMGGDGKDDQEGNSL